MAATRSNLARRHLAHMCLSQTAAAYLPSSSNWNSDGVSLLVHQYITAHHRVIPENGTTLSSVARWGTRTLWHGINCRYTMYTDNLQYTVARSAASAVVRIEGLLSVGQFTLACRNRIYLRKFCDHHNAAYQRPYLGSLFSLWIFEASSDCCAAASSPRSHPH